MKYLYYQQIFQIKILNSNEIKVLDTNCLINLTALEKKFCLKYKINIAFCLIVNDKFIYNIIKQFQDYITDIIKYLDYICYCYSCFVDFN